MPRPLPAWNYSPSGDDLRRDLDAAERQLATAHSTGDATAIAYHERRVAVLTARVRAEFGSTRRPDGRR